MFIDSWLFLFTSRSHSSSKFDHNLLTGGILIFGVGLELHSSVCSAGIFTCIVFYSTSKLLIYAYLSEFTCVNLDTPLTLPVERVYVVWAPVTSQQRFRSPIYLLCFATVCAYAVIIMLLFFGEVVKFAVLVSSVPGREDRLRAEDSVCLIGLKRLSSYPLLIYDLCVLVQFRLGLTTG